MFATKDQSAIQAMREGGKMLAAIVQKLKTTLEIGMTTLDVNHAAEALMAQYGVMPSFKGYRGFPGVVCVSINEEIVHAIPGNRKIQDGDVVKIDCGIIHKGYHTDHAITVLIGSVKPEVRKFVEIIESALYKGIEQIKPGNKIGDIGAAIQYHVESHGYSVIRDFIGHGIGKKLHEPPEIPNIGKKGTGGVLIPGMTICIEPICAMGKRYSYTLSDGWTAVTRDGGVACQVEHTILVTERGYEILTSLT